jgi:hypothetical protein
MFGTFDEKAIAAYAEQVKQKPVKSRQGTEWTDNLGVGENDHSFLDNDESQDAKDYTEFGTYDFGACIRLES